MKEITLNGTKRAMTGKKATKAVRREGLVPCNIYGQQKDADGAPVAVSFTLTEKEAKKLVYTPNIYLINLNLDGEPCKAILREIQFHPVKDNILHIDLLQVVEDKPIVIGVPIKTEGHAEGVRAGGKLVTLVRKVNVRALYKDVPETLVVDVTNLQLGKSIKVADLSFENLELVTPAEVNVVSVKMTRAAMSAAANAANTATEAETEAE
ncbi:MAG: 50S ribosomal protein L25/general stress protein Ctc [Alloprevotella sp.]|nr:50S ribosomal protein L25/general stress protein Ctc [Alloprevotella sp.]